MQDRVKRLMEITAKHGACVDALPEDRDKFIRIPESRDDAEDALQYCRRCTVRSACFELMQTPAAEGSEQVPGFDGVAGGRVFIDGEVRAPESLPVDPRPFTLMLRALYTEGYPWSEIAAGMPHSADMVRDWGVGARGFRMSQEAQRNIRLAYLTLPIRDVELMVPATRGPASKAARRGRELGWPSRADLRYEEPGREDADRWEEAA